jgi:UDP-N-acetylglucosamine transferase subunit ALG13
VIFVTVGTHQQPFHRMLAALSALPSEEMVVQYGYGAAPAGVAHAAAFMSFREMTEQFERADTVVTHAGVGSILMAMRFGHTPIVVPRYKRYGEHVDDHQLQLTRALAEGGRVIAAWNTGELAAIVAAAPERRPPPERGERPIHAAVRAALRGQEIPCPDGFLTGGAASAPAVRHSEGERGG